MSEYTVYEFNDLVWVLWEARKVGGFPKGEQSQACLGTEIYVHMTLLQTYQTLL